MGGPSEADVRGVVKSRCCFSLSGRHICCRFGITYKHTYITRWSRDIDNNEDNDGGYDNDYEDYNGKKNILFSLW